MLRHFSRYSDEQLVELGLQSNRLFLEHLASNQASKHIEHSLEQYRENNLPQVTQEEIEAEDINLSIFAWRKTFLYFLPDYTGNTSDLIEIVKELDVYLLELQNRATGLFIKLLKSRISENAHFIEKITGTSPGLIYVTDIATNRHLYTNKPYWQLLGYKNEKDYQPARIDAHLHPEDVEISRKFNHDFQKTKDGEVKSIKYRIRTGEGEFRWVRCFETAFKRNEKGELVEKIGICIDIHEQKLTAEKLQKREAELLEAQEIAKIGSFTWDLSGAKSQSSPQTKLILELTTDDQEEFFSRVHPDDLLKLKEAIAASMKSGYFEAEYRFSCGEREKILSTKGRVHFKDGKPEFLNGTILDITEKATLIQQLRQQQSIYKRVEELASMGNWTWDLKKNTLEWSDNLYRMYGLNPETTDISIEKFLEFVHPEDRNEVKTFWHNINTKQNIDHTFRIITTEGQEKYIRSLAQSEENNVGKPIRVIGTERDVTEKHHMVASLLKSEQLYKQAQALASIGNWSWEVDTDKIEWSEELYKIYGLSPDEHLTYDMVAGFVHPEEKDDVKLSIEESIRTGEIYDRHHRIILRNGTEKVIHRRAEVIKEEGKPTRLVGTTQDITAFYRVQQELKDNQNFILKITDATPSIITTYNVNTGKYVFVSKGIEKLGYTVSNLMEKGIAFFYEIIHREDLALVKEKNKNALIAANQQTDDNNIIFENTFRIKDHSGTYRWYHTYGTVFDRNANGKVEHLLNIMIDVTEQQTANIKIKEQEHFIQQIADASPTILYLYDVQKQSIVYINREIFFVLGYHPDEILSAGENITELLYDPEDYHLLPARKQSEKNFSQVDSMIQYECRIKSKDGEFRWFLVREIVFKTDSNGNISQILGAALDINRRKEMEKTILQNTLLLEQSNSSLEEFAYVASHDLKEPLRKISTFGDRLAATHLELLSPEGKIYLNKILDASERMQTMISDLLSISMITGNRSYEKFSLQKILEETILTLEYKIENQNAVIRHNQLPDAMIIPSQIRQLFLNLLSNSLKFVREDVQPLITISHEFIKQKDIVHYQLAPAENYLKIVFSDNGIGFENEFAGKIFAIFQRLHGRSEYEGSGIGLAICKKIVEHHGGIISAESKPGEGATFTIILPHE